MSTLSMNSVLAGAILGVAGSAALAAEPPVDVSTPAAPHRPGAVAAGPATSLTTPAPLSVSNEYGIGGYGGYRWGAVYGTPGGYEGRIGSPYHYFAPNGGEYVVTGNPYYDHFGPGFHRESLYGHYRFPYYNYRAPWYYPGRAVYNRDTNFAW